MLENRLSKINTDTLVQVVILIALIVFVAVNARLIVDNILNSNKIDEKIVSEANPRLNRKLMDEAKLSVQNIQVNSELTSSSPSATLELEAAEPEDIAEISLEIQNASSINGAAGNIADKLIQKGYQVSAISTAPAKQTKTILYYQAGKKGVAQALKEYLLSQDWQTEIIESKEIKTDILIVLGK